LWGFIGHICMCEFYISSSIGWTTLLPSPSHQEGNARCPVSCFFTASQLVINCVLV
jgi:hypothetical protein